MSSTVTPENSAYNLRTLTRTVAAAQGVDPDNLTYEQRIVFIQALGAAILAHPQSFTDETLAIAQRQQDQSYGALDDDSFQWSDFAADTAANAVPVFGGFTNKLLIIGALALVTYIVVKNWPGGPHPLPAQIPA